MTAAPTGAVAARVDRVLAEFLDGEQARWEAVDPDLAAPFTALRAYVLPGGKRVRPAFCYWSFVGAGGAADDPGVAVAGAALELLHAAALIHDDVIDGSATRHGAAALHVQFADDHRGQGWSGDPAQFGEGAAVLVGDLAAAYSNRLLGSAPPQAVAVFDGMRIDVNLGQYLDVMASTRRYKLDGPEATDRARRIARYKTAKYTVEGPVHLGVALADPHRLPELAGPLSAFALPLGEAFQLRDDLLGVFGDPATTGKPVGDDLREGKHTLLVALAAGYGTTTEQRLLAERFGAPDLTEAEVKTLQDLILSSGAKARVEQQIQQLHDQATAELHRLPLAPSAITALSDLAAFVTGRDH